MVVKLLKRPSSRILPLQKSKNLQIFYNSFLFLISGIELEAQLLIDRNSRKTIDVQKMQIPFLKILSNIHQTPKQLGFHQKSVASYFTQLPKRFKTTVSTQHWEEFSIYNDIFMWLVF